MYYIYIQNNIAAESIPEFDPNFPSMPAEKRYSRDFLRHCVQWDETVQQGWLYDPATNTFTAPPEPEPADPPVEPPADPDALKEVQEEIAYIIDTISEIQLAMCEIYEGMVP